VLRAHHDFESASAVNLKRVGVHVYAKHPSTFVWCMCWRLGDGRIFNWRPGAPDPVPLLDHVYRGGMIVAHNAGFERHIWNDLVCDRIAPHWPRIAIEQQDCTMARAQAVSMPAGLDALCLALRMAERKDEDGSRLMKQMMKPRSVKNGVTVWWDDEPRRQRLEIYCAQDVEVESQVDARLPFLSDRERRVWIMDQHMSDRGVTLDERMIGKLQGVVDVAKLRLNAAMHEVTGGAIRSCDQTKELAKWITEQGVPCKSVAAEEHEELVLEAGTHRPDIIEALRLRTEAGKASTAKLKAMRETLGDDSRSRGTTAYSATLSKRWAGRLWQPHNLKTREDEEVMDVALAMQMAERIEAPEVLADCFSLILRPPMAMCSLSLRSLMVAGPGKKLVGGDKSNIEGRINAWLAGEDWKLKAFREYDAGIGPDLYRVAYASSFGVPVESVKGATRQVGKVQELSLGYQGSVGAYVKMAKAKGIKLDKVRDTVKGAATESEWEVACRNYPSARNKAGLDLETWAAVSIVVKRWRAKHPAIVQGWWDLQDAAVEAVASPGEMVSVFGGRIRYVAARGFLWCGLPSGTVIAYPYPAISVEDESYVLYPDGQRMPCEELFPGEITAAEAAGAHVVPRERKIVTFSHQEKNAFVRDALYGGMQCAHVVSAIARDALVEDMFEAERRGYSIILTVHDELLTEMDLDKGTAQELQDIMSTVPFWIDGDLPLSAKCWEGYRYGK
jgi:DNA polymerase